MRRAFWSAAESPYYAWINSDTVQWERYGLAALPLFGIVHGNSHPTVSSVRSGLQLFLVSISCSYIRLSETKADLDLVWDSEVLLHQHDLEISNDHCLILCPSILQKGGSQSLCLLRLLREYYDVWKTTPEEERNKIKMGQKTLCVYLLAFPPYNN